MPAAPKSVRDTRSYHNTAQITRTYVACKWQYNMDSSSWASARAAAMDAAKHQLHAEASMLQQSIPHSHFAPPQRPTEHFLTLAADGSILGATDTITGFTPSSLLMTSAYDTVHALDLVGLKAVTQHFWEKGRGEVTAYIRRRTIEGEWIWLATNLVEYIDVPAPGIIVRETVASDIRLAKSASRITRISAVLALAVESAWALRKKRALEEEDRNKTIITNGATKLDDGSIHASNEAKLSTNDENTTATQQNNVQQDHHNKQNHNPNYTVQNDAKNANQEFLDVLKTVRSGVSLDMSKIVLSSSELKMVTVILTGRLQIEDIGSLVVETMSNYNTSPHENLSTAIDKCILRKGEQQQQVSSSNIEVPTTIHTNNTDSFSVAESSTTSLTSMGTHSASTSQRHRNSNSILPTQEQPQINRHPSNHHHHHHIRDHHPSMPAPAFYGNGINNAKSNNAPKTTTSPYLLSVKTNHAPLAFGGGNNSAMAATTSSRPVYSNPTLSEAHRRRHCTSTSQSPSTSDGNINSPYEEEEHGKRQPSSLSPQHASIPAPMKQLPPPLSVVNVSYSNIGNSGLETLSEILYVDTPYLKTLDISFCGVDERGVLVLCRALRKRKKRGLANLQGLILSGNVVSYRAAKDLGSALSNRSSGAKKDLSRMRKSSSRVRETDGTGYDEDNEYDVEDWDEDEDDKDVLFGEMTRKMKGGGHRSKSALTGRRHARKRSAGNKKEAASKDVNNQKKISVTESKMKKEKSSDGLLLLHLACCSLTSESFYQLLLGLGQECPLRELRVPSNSLGPEGATLLMQFLDGIGIPKYKRGQPVFPFLDRLDLSNNKLGNDGVAALTKAISKRKKVNFAELRLSSNDIGPLGIETIMNKLFQHNILSLQLDNNAIGDRGCQLVAASLPSMHSLLKLSLSFNQIGTRGVTSLMRALLGCESLMSLALSGNAMKVSGSIAMGFSLAHHPRLEELELDNCCLSQAAQCHIVAGIISNRWVPMKNLTGFRVAPPMVAIGALDVIAQSLGNEECFRIRRDMQMQVILQWMQANQIQSNMEGCLDDANINSVAAQSGYRRMLDWLSQISFDEDELLDLQNYFFEVDGGENSDGAAATDINVVLKHRGDLLANLSTEAAEEIRDINPVEESQDPELVKIGMSIESESESEAPMFLWKSLSGKPSLLPKITEKPAMPILDKKISFAESTRSVQMRDDDDRNNEYLPSNKRRKSCALPATSTGSLRRSSVLSEKLDSMEGQALRDEKTATMYRSHSQSSRSVCSERSGMSSDSKQKEQNTSNAKARITMFPQFETKLHALKQHAQETMDIEYDPAKQDFIAQEFAEASLTLLRQLRYHCMNSGLDGWRQGKVRRKVLIVDDSIVTRKMVARAFEKANFIVDTAENGEEGVQKLKDSIYDIAFMDIDMPVMNGFDATKSLREWEDVKRPGVRQPICALTASYVDDFERSELMKFKEAGLDVMESKPCNIPRLFKVVDDVSPMFSDLTINATKLGTSPAPQAPPVM